MGPFFNDDIHHVCNADAGNEECQETDREEENGNAEADLPADFFSLDEIPHAERSFVRGVKPVLASEDSEDFALHALLLTGVRRANEQRIHPRVPVGSPEGRIGHNGPSDVGAVIHRCLKLLLHNANDDKRNLVDGECLADRLFCFENVLRDVGTQKEHPPLIHDVELVQKSSLGTGEHSAHFLEERVDPFAFRCDGGFSVCQRDVSSILRRDEIDRRYGLRQKHRIIFHHTDPAAFWQALKDQSRLTAIDNENPIARIQHALHHLVAKAFAKREKKHHRHCSPGDRHDRENCTSAMSFQVLEEFFEQLNVHLLFPISDLRYMMNDPGLPNSNRTLTIDNRK